MVAGIDAIVNALDFAVLVDQEADAGRVTRLGIVACSIGHPERTIGVAQQRKIEAILFCEGGVVLDRVKTRSEDGNIVLDEVILLVAEPAPLDRSSGSVSFGIEPEQHLLSAQAAERDLFALVSRKGKVRSGVPFLRYHRRFLESDPCKSRQRKTVQKCETGRGIWPRPASIFRRATAGEPAVNTPVSAGSASGPKDCRT
jgi:hypothetical protein